MPKPSYWNSQTKRVLFNPKESLYRSWLLRRLINLVPCNNKTKSRLILYRAFVASREKLNMPLFASQFSFAAAYLRPHSWLRHFKRGQRDYFIPHMVTQYRQLKLMLRWLMRAVFSNDVKNMQESLSEELQKLLNGESLIFEWRANLEYQLSENNHNFRFLLKSRALVRKFMRKKRIFGRLKQGNITKRVNVTEPIRGKFYIYAPTKIWRHRLVIWEKGLFSFKKNRDRVKRDCLRIMLQKGIGFKEGVIFKKDFDSKEGVLADFTPGELILNTTFSGLFERDKSFKFFFSTVLRDIQVLVSKQSQRRRLHAFKTKQYLQTDTRLIPAKKWWFPTEAKKEQILDNLMYEMRKVVSFLKESSAQSRTDILMGSPEWFYKRETSLACRIDGLLKMFEKFQLRIPVETFFWLKVYLRRAYLLEKKPNSKWRNFEQSQGIYSEGFDTIFSEDAMERKSKYIYIRYFKSKLYKKRKKRVQPYKPPAWYTFHLKNREDSLPGEQSNYWCKQTICNKFFWCGIWFNMDTLND